MKVLHFISSSGFFGAENVLINLAREQKTQGLEVFLGVFDNLGRTNLDIVTRAQDNSIPDIIIKCRGRFDLRAIGEIKRFLIENQIDIIHSHNYKSNFYVICASFGLKLKKVTTCHNWTKNSFKMRLFKFFDLLMLKGFDRVAAVSDKVKDEILNAGISRNKVIVIKNGINVTAFAYRGIKSSLIHDLNLESKKPLIGAIGRLSDEKGHIFLIRAMHKIIEKYNKAHCLIVGEGPSRECLQLEIKNLKLENNVTLTGKREDIPEILNSLDFFVLPSLDEGLPIALLEAMAAQKAIVASDVGAIKKAIQNDYNGKLVAPGVVSDLADAILELLDDKEKTELFEKRALEGVRNQFSSSAMNLEYMKLYNSL